MARATWHERRLYWHNRPLTTALLHLVARAGKVVYVPGLGYAVNDPEVAVQILAHPAFRSTGHGSMDELITALVGPAALFNMDGSVHRQVRSHLTGVFSRRNIERLAGPEAGALAGRVRADLEAGRRVDLIPVVRQLTSSAACALLGIAVAPSQHAAVYDEMARLATRMTRFLGLDKLQPTPATLRQARVYYDRLLAFAAPSYAVADPRAPTVIGQLKAAGWSFEEARGLIAVLLLAGTETVMAALPRLVALLIDEGEFAGLVAHPERLPDVIVEGLRVICPSPAIPRAIHADAAIAGVRFKRGRRLFILLYNVLKRDAYFPHSRRLDPTRSVEARFRHLCFGSGAHFCIGFALAHWEITVMLEELLRVPGPITIVSRSYPRDMSFPGYTRLVLEQGR